MSADDARAAAWRALPRAVFDFVDGAAERELTMGDNIRAFEEVRFRQSAAVDVGTPDLTTTVLGARMSVPVAFAPCGLLGTVHPAAEGAVARVASAHGTVAAFSTFSSTALEEIAGASEGPKWFQLYYLGGRAGAEELIARALSASYDALVLTVDTCVPGHRERDSRNRVTLPLRVDLRTAVKFGPNALTRPGWLQRFARAGFPLAVANASARPGHPRPDLDATLQGPPPTWDDLGWIREQWSGPIVIKGVMGAEDARRAIGVGADAIVVSNHGGRQLDGTPGTLRVLPEVVAAVDGAVPVLVDGGVRRGSDVVKALALGAAAVLVGRPYVFGLAAGGEAGVARILEIFREEMIRTMQLLGCRSIGELGTDHLWTPSNSAAVT